MIPEKSLKREMVRNLANDSSVHDVKKFELKCIMSNMDILVVPAHTEIAEHSHEKGLWEAWILTELKKVFICLDGETHFLANHSDKEVRVLAVKGSSYYSFEDFEKLFSNIGFEVFHGNVEIK